MAHVFDPEELARIARSAIAARRDDGAGDGGLAAMIEDLVDRLAGRYPGHVQRGDEWILNNAGGAMGMMRVLHASITEYLIVFGSPIGTEGHTGRFLADDWFIILDGEQWAYREGALHREVYRPGEVHHLERGVAKGYRMPDRCFALEYARGIIPLMLPFGFADALTSTMDFPTLARTVRAYTRSALAELRRGKV